MLQSTKYAWWVDPDFYSSRKSPTNVIKAYGFIFKYTQCNNFEKMRNF